MPTHRKMQTSVFIDAKPIRAALCFSALQAIEPLAGLHSFVHDGRLAPVSIVPFLL